jgi:lipopolysaccharide biosynthesis glycosyltransferase
METITVAICADDRYAPGLMVTLGSILLYADPSVTINAVVLDCGITGQNWTYLTQVVENCVTLARLQRLELMINALALDRGITRQNWRHLTHAAEKCGPRVCLQRLQLDRSRFHGLPPGPLGSDAVYARLLLPELLGDAPTVVYLDSDIIFFKDIAEFARMPLAGCAAVVCRDELVKWIRNDAIEPECDHAGEPYFNSGVMLIDLDYWRREGVGRQTLDLLRRHGEKCRFWDQTALNHLLVGKMRFADTSWNRVTSTDLDGFLANPFNVHLVSQHKPWLTQSANFFAQLWYVAYQAITGRKWAFGSV